MPEITSTKQFSQEVHIKWIVRYCCNNDF
jgi:hypothetical protein